MRYTLHGSGADPIRKQNLSLVIFGGNLRHQFGDLLSRKGGRMSYVVARMQKMKSGNLSGSYKHN
ncbi:plasmid recombination protein, partial [Streptococcus agalactiae]|nr:plasmid recombination protein [Streptococcus agalactiae]